VILLLIVAPVSVDRLQSILPGRFHAGEFTAASSARTLLRSFAADHSRSALVVTLLALLLAIRPYDASAVYRKDGSS